MVLMASVSIAWIQTKTEKRSMLQRNILENVIMVLMPNVCIVFLKKMRTSSTCLLINTLIKISPSVKCIDPIKNATTVWWIWNLITKLRKIVQIMSLIQKECARNVFLHWSKWRDNYTDTLTMHSSWILVKLKILFNTGWKI